MRQHAKDTSAWLSALAVAALILDSKTATRAGLEAVDLCIRVLIPSLFPFFVFSPMLAAGDFGRALRPIARFIRIPDGAETLLIASFLGGYPVGASLVAYHCRSGDLSAEDGRRMMAFCSNAGPSFIFGVGAQLFPSIRYCWALWLIHLVSAIIVGLLTPGKSSRTFHSARQEISITDGVKKGVLIMASVCAWVIIFRILLSFCDRWFLRIFPSHIQILFSGFLELANGCSAISKLEPIGMRMVFFSAFLGFGGMCVWLQTKAVTVGVNSYAYLPGKLTHCACSILLSTMIQPILNQTDRFYAPWWIIAICCLVPFCYRIFLQKNIIEGRNPALIGV